MRTPRDNTGLALSAVMGWLCLAGLCARAEEPNPARLGAIAPAPRVQADGVDFVLHGAGFLRVGFVFKAYGAALYVQRHADAARILEDVPKRLEIHYLHNTPRARMIEAADTTLARNLDPAALAAVRADVARLHAAYTDRRAGDVAALTYVPGRGTSLAVNGAERIRIMGPAFAAAYFAVWLGEQPSSRTVKDQLLNR
jgi:hypothetical protein